MKSILCPDTSILDQLGYIYLIQNIFFVNLLVELPLLHRAVEYYKIVLI